MGWDVDGVVATRIVGLHYNEPSRTLLVHAKRATRTKYEASSLFTRGLDETQYKQVFGPDDWTYIESIVVASRAPMAFFDLITIERDSGPEPRRAWPGIRRLDLITGEVTVALDAASFAKRHHHPGDPELVPAAARA
jgi:hypothetical protein